MILRNRILVVSFVLCVLSLELLADERPNVVYILCDDHRFDAMGLMGHPFLETPHLDAMAKNGVQLTHAFVTNSLCSPSRASILTGLYPHNHGVGDNYNPVDPKLKFFPEYLQRAGYSTAFFGKWHMGDADDPQRGFDHWCAFRGQGTYYPDGHGTTRVVPQTRYDGFNINGNRVPQKGYITDELTDFAIDIAATNPSTEVLIAVMPRPETLRAAVAWIDERAALPKERRRIGPNDTFLVPNIALKVTKRFESLEGRSLDSLDGAPLQVARQDILFRLDKTGARLTSAATLLAAPIPSNFVADRPFVVVLRKRGRAEPYFVLWVEDAETLERANS